MYHYDDAEQWFFLFFVLFCYTKMKSFPLSPFIYQYEPVYWVIIHNCHYFVQMSPDLACDTLQASFCVLHDTFPSHTLPYCPKQVFSWLPCAFLAPIRIRHLGLGNGILKPRSGCSHSYRCKHGHSSWLFSVYRGGKFIHTYWYLPVLNEY